MNQRHSSSHGFRPLVFRLVCALVFIAVSSAALAHTMYLPPALREFKTAWNRVAQGKTDLSDPASVRALAIYPYLVAARLQRDLAGPKARSVETRVPRFLGAHAGQLVTRRLTADWLHSLAKQRQWKLLIANYAPSEADGPLRCEWLHARIEVGDTRGLPREIIESYLVGHSQPQCRPAFRWLAHHGRLPDELVIKRVKLALKTGHTDFARQLIATLPVQQAKPFLEWVKLVDHPKSALKTLLTHPAKQIPERGLEDCWFLLTRQHPDIALKLYPRLRLSFHLRGVQLRPFIRDLALGLAWNRDFRAIEFFKKFAPKRGDIRTLTWRVRSALWSGDWNDAKAWIEAMPKALQSQPEWQYWRARTEAATGDAQAARASYERLAGTDGYYALLAAWRLSRTYVPRATPVANIRQLQNDLARWPGMQRAHELFEVGLPSLAAAEWLAALDKASTEERVQAIRLASQWGWYSEAVGTATSQGIFEDYHLLYPFPYRHLVRAAARRYDLRANWIYGLMRQESLYDPKAVSAAAAYGLMQLQLPTARVTANFNRLPAPRDADALFDPKTNVMLGSAHLRDLLIRERNSLIVALAAYNAGHNAAENWLPKRPVPADIWIDNIPYDETRVYIKRVLWHIAVFAWLHSGQAQSIWRQMANVQPLAIRIVARASQ